jgi:hypothetical protein
MLLEAFEALSMAIAVDVRPRSFIRYCIMLRVV